MAGVLAVLSAVLATVGNGYPSPWSHWKRSSLTAPIQITVTDTSRDASWTAATKAAIATWNTAVPADIRFVYKATPGKSCPSVFSSYVGVCVMAYPFVNYWGYTGVQESGSLSNLHITRAVISLNTTPNYTPTDAPTRAQIVAHEFGHALGLDHEFGAGTLMDYCWGCPGALAPSAGEIQSVHDRHSHVG